MFILSFEPKEDITPFELASIVQHASGVMYWGQVRCSDADWAAAPSGEKRHFRVVSHEEEIKKTEKPEKPEPKRGFWNFITSIGR